MWGTSWPEDKLAGDLGNVIEATLISGRRPDFFTAGKLALGNLGLLQHYLPCMDGSELARTFFTSQVGRCGHVFGLLVRFA
jgi:hypothetical protein